MFSIITKRDKKESDIIRLADKIIGCRVIAVKAEDYGNTHVSGMFNEIAGDLAGVAFNKANQLAYTD